MIIGKIGTGKSSFCQSLCDVKDKEIVFKKSADKNSCTQDTKIIKVFWRNSQDEFILIDSPG